MMAAGRSTNSIVMAVLVTAIHDFNKGVDARNKSGHDGCNAFPPRGRPAAVAKDAQLDTHGDWR